MQTFHYKGYDLPIELIEMTGGGPDTFADISSKHQMSIMNRVMVSRSHRIVEIGHGIGRDAIQFAQYLNSGFYIGIDIIGRSVDWCINNISARHSNFKFHHFNVYDYLHNPSGELETADLHIPAEDGSVDRVFMFSVFTHLMQPDIEHYLKECHRVLKDSGRVYTTMFAYDPNILAKAHETNLIRFDHDYADHCRVSNLERPLQAVAYSDHKIHEMAAIAGFELADPIHRGSWSGIMSNPIEGQDVIILRKTSQQ